MKTTINHFLIIACLFANSAKQLYAEEIPTEKAFFYLIKIFGLTNDNYYRKSYAINFDPDNYKNTKSDEFERQRYNDKIRKAISAGVSKVDFNQKFSETGRSVLGEYNFTEAYFPISSWSFDISRSFKSDGGLGFYFNIQTNDAINLGDFNGLIKMNGDAANSFIKKRKTMRAK